MNLLNDLKNPLWEKGNIIYCYTNLINGKKYVGQVGETQNLKKRHHKHMKKDLIIDKALRKYGECNFSLEILHFAKTREELNYFEDFYIRLFNCFSKTNKGYNVARGGSNGSTFFGKTDDELNEIKEKIRIKATGRKNNAVSEQNRNRIITDKIRDNMSKSHMKKILQFDMNENLIKEWDSIKEASDILNIDNSGITKCCKNKRKTCGGYIWKYKQN